MKKWTLLTALFIFLFTGAYSQGTGDLVRAVFIDEHDVKWFGTDQGLLRYDGTSWKAYNTRFDTPGEVSDLEYQLSAYGSEIWIGTESGVSVANYSVDGVTSATRYATDNSGMQADSVMDVVLDSSDTRFFATPQGVGVFEGAEWTWLERGFGDADAGVPDYPLLSVGAENDTVYIGSDGRGVGRIKNEVDGFTGASYYEIPWSGIASNKVQTIFTDSEGYQWFGTDQGISMHSVQDAKSGWDVYLTTNEGLVNDNVHAIFEDQSGMLWFGTEGGLSRYDRDGGTFTNYTTDDGLPDNRIYDIDEDGGNNLWIATASGVSQFDGSEFTNISTAEHAKNFENIITTVIPDEINGSNEPFSVYPNPAREEVWIHFRKQQSGWASIGVFDLSGKQVRNLYEGYTSTGDLKVKWDLRDAHGNSASNGIYFITLNDGSRMHTRKLVVLQ